MGFYEIPIPMDLQRFTVLGEREEFSEIWLSKDEAIQGHIRQTDIRSVATHRDEGSIFAAIRELIDGRILCLEGEFEDLVEWLRRARRILDGMQLSRIAARRFFWRCTVLLSQGKPLKVRTGGMAQRVLRDFRSLMVRSTVHPVYVPAILIETLYLSDSLFSEDSDNRLTRRIRRRFLEYDCDIWEPANGIPLHIRAGVFVPDPFVIDLLGSAILEPGSCLLNDIQEKEILEPCTGTGILAITLARFGARRVYSSDIDFASVQSARVNAKSSCMTEKISVEQKFGLPEQDAEVVFANPPWYGSIRQLRGIRLTPSERRCYLDEGHHLLTRLLDTAGQSPTIKTFYLFMGEFDPLDGFRDRAGKRLLDVQELGWVPAAQWEGARSVRLYRLRKIGVSE